MGCDRGGPVGAREAVEIGGDLYLHSTRAELRRLDRAEEAGAAERRHLECRLAELEVAS